MSLEKNTTVITNTTKGFLVCDLSCIHTHWSDAAVLNKRISIDGLTHTYDQCAWMGALKQMTYILSKKMVPFFAKIVCYKLDRVIPFPKVHHTCKSMQQFRIHNCFK